jgi:ribosomal RNA-processing protein 8
MALFNVPGWSVPADPVAVAPKKRKRISKHESNKIRSATVNVEKVMQQLAARPGPTAETPHHQVQDDKNGGLSAEGVQPPKKKRRRVKGNKSQQAPTFTAVQHVETHRTSKKKGKDRPKETSGDEIRRSQLPSTSQLASGARSTLTDLQHDMKQSLDGARFRYVIHPNFYAGNSHLRTLTWQMDQREAL